MDDGEGVWSAIVGYGDDFDLHAMLIATDVQQRIALHGGLTRVDHGREDAFGAHTVLPC
jgi:hypothetical protein